MAPLSANSLLPALHLAIHAAVVQVYAYMLGIRTAGNSETRTGKGTVSGDKTNTEVPPMGRKRIRPRSMNNSRQFTPKERILFTPPKGETVYPPNNEIGLTPKRQEKQQLNNYTI